MPCEDFPCCGHQAGDCPTLDSKGRERWTCVGCGKRLPLHAPSSICGKCQRSLTQRGYEGSYGDFDDRMNY